MSFFDWLASLFKKPTPPPTPPAPPAGVAVFEDFNGAAKPNLLTPWLSVSPDRTSAQTDYPRNASLDGNSHLTITAIRERVSDPRVPGVTVSYTSATLTTRGKLERQYGTWSARIFFPPGKGHHPTFALFGANEATNPWPNCGEVDIMELQETLQGSSIHGPGYDWTHGTQISTPAPLDVRGDWHTYWCKHEKDKLTIGVDNTTICVYTPASLPPGKTWVFNQPVFALFDLSIGSDATPTTVFPITMLVDWLRYTP